MTVQKIFYVLAIILFSGLILWLGKPFLVPLTFGFLFALVLYPLCQFFESKSFPKFLSIGIPIVLLCLIFGGIAAILGYELVTLSGKWSLIQQQIDPLLAKIQQQLEIEFGWTAEKQAAWISESLNKLSQNAGMYLSETMNTIFGALVHLLIIPIYASLILVYRNRLVSFITSIAPVNHQSKINTVALDMVRVFSKFIRGMLMVYLIVGLLNSLGLWIIGVETPMLYGMISALMTVIPLFGIIISGLVPITITWIETGSLWQPVGIIVVFGIVQYLEANLIFPSVVGKFVNLNTLASIIAVFMGALIWRVAGMILFIPLFAVLNLFASQFKELHPISKLLSNK